MQVLKVSSDILLKHLRWNSSHSVDQSLVNILEHNFLHWLLEARWQQCHLAESMPTLSILETSTEVETTLSGFRKHCQKCSCKALKSGERRNYLRKCVFYLRKRWSTSSNLEAINDFLNGCFCKKYFPTSLPAFVYI